ncbi:MAG: phosphate ABC transporter permease PstA [candidate division NC10 bacterium]|nr:phosphate ABC transporter permease PstA [candidate division NC10 bacterium]
MKNFWRSGEPFVWLTGGALALSLIMVAGLVFLVMANGLGFFWPSPIVRLTLADGTVQMGEVTDREAIPTPGTAPGGSAQFRIQLKVGNRDLYGADFVWLDEPKIVKRETPADAVLIQRREWGNLYGVVAALKEGGQTVAQGDDAGWAALQARLPEAQRLFLAIRKIEKDEVGAINFAQEKIRLRLRRLELHGVTSGAEVDTLKQEMAALQGEFKQEESRLNTLRRQQTASVIVAAAGGKEKDLPLAQIVRATRPNTMSLLQKGAFYLATLWEFLTDDPRESNTEGGIFPAIFGTVMMVLIMSILVTPLGVLAAFYLREYAKQGPFVSAVRIAVNNLAGVPSIVFGVFGVGFFIYIIGGGIDRIFFPEALPTPTFGTGGILWASLTLALLTVPVVIVATEEGLAAIPPETREGSLALGATKLETTWRVVLPAVMPSILTGLILAMARAAGEVAPLMITGVVKLAPALPLDGFFPFFHLERKFMHLGFHIYDVGFQSPNVDAARPMVFTTAFLLLVLVLALNLAAILIRNRLRKKFAAVSF